MKRNSSKQKAALETAALSVPAKAYSYRLLLSVCLLVMISYGVWMGSALIGIFVLSLLTLLFCGDVLLHNAWKDVNRQPISFSVFVAVSVLAAFFYNLSKTFFLRPLAGPIAQLYIFMSLTISLYLWNCLKASRSKERTFVFIKKLVDFLPKSGRLLHQGRAKMAFANELVPGDLISVKAGETIPCDGVITRGNTAIDESLVTGNMLPAIKTTSDIVYAGTVNKKEDIQVRVTKKLEESVVAGIIHSIQASEYRRCVRRNPLDEYAWLGLLWAGLSALGGYLYVYWAGGYVRPLHSLGMSLLALGIGCPISFFLVVACPVFFARRGSKRRHIRVQAWGALDVLEQADTVFCDKTGTLTYGELRVSSVHPVQDTPSGRQTFITCLATAEQKVEGPFAKAILLFAQEQQMAPRTLSTCEVLPGLGVRAVSGKDTLLVGRAAWLREQGVKVPAMKKAACPVVCAAQNDVYLGYVLLDDAIRPGAAHMVKYLQRRGKEVILMSGDNEDSTRAVASALGIKKVNFDVLPQTKAEILSNYAALGKKTVMIGDGFNDITALLKADAGVVFSSGKNVYNNWVDIIISRPDLQGVIELFSLHRRVKKCVVENVLLSLFCNAALLASLLFATDGTWETVYTLPVGSILGVGLVLLNSARLLRIK